MLRDVIHLVHILPEPSLLVSGDGTVCAANDAVTELTGVDRKAIIGAPLTSLLMNTQEKLERYLALCARSRQLVPGSLVWRAKDGQPADLRCDGAVVVERDGAQPATLFLRCRPKAEATDQFLLLNQKIAALSKEIVERKKAEQQRDLLLVSERAARLEAERTSQMKDEFLATLSHELRTPLNAILGWAQLLLRNRALPGDAAKGLEVIERNARVQTQLIEDLLDMSRIISGKVRLDVQRVDLSMVIEAAVASVMPAAEAKGIRIQQAIDPIAGPVKGDPSRLQQVVWNLLTNAVKFTPKGGRVQVFLERVNSHVEISVIDTGEGIEPDFLPHVFDRFLQADAGTTRRHGGLGLGLSIVKQLVELHGGTVRAKSAGKNKGAAFMVALPLLVVHEEEKPAARVHPRSGTRSDLPCEGINLDGVRVLVVDDEADARILVQRVMEGCKAEVMTAESAAEAVAAVGSFHPHVIVSDIGMPEQDGYDLIRRVRALSSDAGGCTPAIALTAFARSEDRVRAMMAGFQVHLSKPIEPTELIVAVGSLAGRVGGNA